MPQRRMFDPKNRHAPWHESIVIENNPLARKSRSGRNKLAMGWTSRTFACESCGQLRRREWTHSILGPVSIDTKDYPTPRCCGNSMRFLGKAQANAVGKLTREQIVKWLRLGGDVRVDRRRWIAVMKQKVPTTRKFKFST